MSLWDFPALQVHERPLCDNEFMAVQQNKEQRWKLIKEQVLPVAAFLRPLTQEQPLVPAFAAEPQHGHPTAQDKDGGKNPSGCSWDMALPVLLWLGEPWSWCQGRS